MSELPAPTTAALAERTVEAVAATAAERASVRAPIEKALRAHLAAGELRAAIAMLMREYGDAVFTRALRVVGDRHHAKDVLQQTFLEAYRDLATFRSESSLRTWLLGIATHRALDLVRLRRREEARTASVEVLQAIIDEATEDAPRQIDLTRQRQALSDCLQNLQPEVRATVLMRFQQGLSYEAISRIAGDRPGTLHARVARALPALRRCLERKGVAP
jgi:RNA polymerase sigma factor (sigma-70 family)